MRMQKQKHLAIAITNDFPFAGVAIFAGSIHVKFQNIFGISV